MTLPMSYPDRARIRPAKKVNDWTSSIWFAKWANDFELMADDDAAKNRKPVNMSLDIVSESCIRLDHWSPPIGVNPTVSAQSIVIRRLHRQRPLNAIGPSFDTLISPPHNSSQFGQAIKIPKPLRVNSGMTPATTCNQSRRWIALKSNGSTSSCPSGFLKFSLLP
jgi:hypothetical protein